MFEPRVALASLSGESDADWARNVESHVGAAFLGGLALDAPTREAARKLVARDRNEFLPADPLEFLDAQLAALDGAPLRVGFNVRAASPEPIREAARICREHDAVVEINAHCRQDEACAVGAGEALLRDTERLRGYVAAAAATGATVGVKVRAEVPGVDLVETARAVEDARARVVHVDAMDSEEMVGKVADATGLFVVANNGVRDAATAEEYLAHGADAVSVGRPSDRPAMLAGIREAVDGWFDHGRPRTNAFKGDSG